MGKKKELKAEIKRLKRINLELIAAAQLEPIEGYFRMFLSEEDIKDLATVYDLCVKNTEIYNSQKEVLENVYCLIKKMNGILFEQ